MNQGNGLFAPIQLGPYVLRNRMVMAPLTRNRAGQGQVPQSMNVRYYRQRASAGLIISEATQVCPEGVGYPNTPGIHSAEQVQGWRAITEAVHEEGGRIFLQLWHVGRTRIHRCSLAGRFRWRPLRSSRKAKSSRTKGSSPSLRPEPSISRSFRGLWRTIARELKMR